MFSLIKYIKEFFGDKSDNGSCEFDFDDSFGNVLNKRFDREARAYDRLSKQYDNFDDLPQAERNTLLHDETQKIRQEDKLEDLKRKSSLRTIKTLRTNEAIEDAVKAGHKVLKQKVEPSKDIRVTDIFIKNTETGEVYTRPNSYGAIVEGTGENKEIIKKKTYYPYTFPSTAAYVLPDGLEVGERVILEDLIEDIVGASHSWGTYRLNSSEAVWNGEKFIVDCESYDVNITFG